RRRGGPQSQGSGLAGDTLRHPDRHVRQALGLGLNLSEPTERFDVQVPGWIAGVALYVAVNLASPVPWVSFWTRTPLALRVPFTLLYRYMIRHRTGVKMNHAKDCQLLIDFGFADF